RRERVEAHRAAAVFVDDYREELAVERGEALLVDVEKLERAPHDLRRDAVLLELGEVARAFQKIVRGARRRAAPRGDGGERLVAGFDAEHVRRAAQYLHDFAVGVILEPERAAGEARAERRREHC